ncbi:MAG: alpha-2-macroglobulin, partial [Planctomycetes bacterium]|nr:alpha-2-macroglobulin [Planctomycetota bacterium]
PRRPSMPELVAEGEGAVARDGVFRIQLATLPAKEIFGDEDHQYLISVEVTDASRRTITGSGKVVAARKPYAVTVWADRGYYRTGEPIQANLRAVAPLGNGVQAGGTAVLYRIRYDENSQPVENKVNSWPIATDQDGSAALRLSADAAGQYRLACTLADAQGRKVEGAVLLTVRGEAGEGDFRFTDLELVPDRSEYQPGDQVRLAVNSSNPDGVVLLFPKAERSGARPLVVRLANGTAIVPIPVAASDQPNFFCEAVTVLDGRSVTETRQIFVPPAEKNLAVTITPEKDSFLPGDEAAFTVKVVDADGAPVRGQIAAVIYDRSIEYISGGSNVGDIRSFYWNWKRDYWPRIDSSLNRAGYLVHKEGDRDWQPIGFFGREEADWNDEAVYGNGIVPTAASGRGVRMRSQAPQPEPAPAAALYQSVEVEASVAMDAAPAPKQAMAGGGDGGETGMAEPALRSDFADTALWLPALETDEDGTARFTATMPENLTAWKVRVWAKADQTRVGETETAVETRKNVIIRPQAPRFLTQKDQVILSANLHNYLPRAKSARVELLLEGGLLTPAPGVELVRSVELPANGETRIDWLVSAARPGSATVIMRLLTDEESDAAAITVPVLFHGSRRIESFGGGLNPGQDETTISFTVPSERLAERSRLELNFSPTLASAMLEALPYLLQYPYGCTEQTLNRFLPLATTRSYLNAIGADLAGAGEAAARAEAARTADSQSSAWLDRYGDSASASRSPLVDEDEYNRMIRAGVDRLATMQNPDGGWGWFSGPGEQSWGHTTATVVYGLLTARANGVAVPTPAMRSGLEWLSRYQDGEIEKIRQYETTSGEQGKQHADNLDAFVHMVLVRAGGGNPQAQDILYQDRLELSLTGLAMLGLALEQENAAVMLETVLENLSQFIQRNDDNNTVWLRTPARGWWLWQHDPIETQAWYLKLLARTNPTGDDAAGLAKYLITNRKNASYWRSTRDTGYAIEALAEYAVASGETDPDITVRILYDGDQVMERRINRGNLLQPQRFVLEGAAVESGRHEIRIIRTGEGRLYFSGLLDVFSHEDPIAAAGNDLKVERRFYKLTPEESTASARSASGGAVRTRVEKYNKQRIPSPFDSMEQAGVQLASGDMVEVELTITAANDYEYLVFEDMKAAGLEAVELVSGYANDGSGAYIEYRDDKVALFIRFLPRGVHTVRYRFRAETPGAFSALPTVGGGMYAPELRANSDEMKIRIGEDGVFE